MDTIFALASARGKAGIAVIRISGPLAHEAGRILGGPLPRARQAAVRCLRDEHGEVLDQALVLAFAAGQSFTGEDVVELHLHGGTAVVYAVQRRLTGLEGLRPAEAGEFSRRALENERLDLAQIEGLGDLIEAETEAQRRQAARVFSGRMGEKVDEWRDKLVRAMALLEATIDFADEEVPEDVFPEVLGILQHLSAEMSRQVAGAQTAERLRDGFEVAIVGPPNVGKSTLLNYLAGREAAITSELAGTTRDVIEVHMDLSGLPVSFLDTAGVRDDPDEIEKIGIARTMERADAADLRVFLGVTGCGTVGIAREPDDICVAGKSDLPGAGKGVSGLTGKGVDKLVGKIVDVLSERVAEVGVAINQRHADMLGSAVGCLARTRTEITGAGQVEIAAEELRHAAVALDSVVGRLGVEDVLEEIFARFCIGK